jgi:hypothetical protein
VNVDWFEISKDQGAAWAGLCPPDEFRVIKPTVVAGLLPHGLLQKYDSIVVAASGVKGTDLTYFLVNGHRVDKKDNAIDQQPFGFIVCVRRTTSSI